VDDSSQQPASTLARHFKGIASVQRGNEPTREIVELLATNQSDPIAFNAILARNEIASGGRFRTEALDLVLEYIRYVLADRAISATEREDVRVLRRILDVEDGELMHLRRRELAILLGYQLDYVLDDALIDDPEELFQVELQAALGLGYDDYLTLIRPSVERVFAALRSLTGDPSGVKSESTERKLNLLEPFYLLVIAARPTA
jgi:hypothetical protein